jgi:hypothetical protein
MKAMLSVLSLAVLCFSTVVVGTVAVAGDAISIQGTIVDSQTKKPLAYANIILKGQSDSSFVKGVATMDHGEFLLANVPRGTYQLQISYIGYETKSIRDIVVTQGSADIQLGTIPVQPTTVSMDAVQVTADRVEEELRPDRKVINVSQDLQSAGGTALDVLAKQPSVRVDGDGNLTIRGSSNFTVLVNGRPSPLTGSDALRQINAGTIDNIEIITNPSSRYDAEGAAGIVNINLRNLSDYSASGLANVGIGTRGKYNADLSGSMSVDRLTLTGGLDFRDQTNYFPITGERVSPGSSGTQTMISNMLRTMRRENFMARAGVDYKVTDRQTLSLSGSRSNSAFRGDWTSKVTNYNGGAVDYSYVANTFDIPVRFVNGQLFYSNKIQPNVDELSAELTVSRVTIPNDQVTEEYVTDHTFDYLTGTSNPKRQQVMNHAERTEGRIKVDYTHTFNPQSRLEVGFQSNLSDRTFDVRAMSNATPTGEWSVDPELSSTFSLGSNVYAAFGQYAGNVEGVGYQVGLRVERMDRVLDIPSLSESYVLRKTDFFPSMNLSAKFDEHSLQLSYSRRITRPNEGMLNPIPFYSDSHIKISGNPELRPEYIHSFELNYQKPIAGLFTSVQTYARLSSNGMYQTQRELPDGRLSLSPANLGRSSTVGAEISTSIPLTTGWKVDPSVNISDVRQSGSEANTSFETSSFTMSSRLNVTGMVSPTTRVQVNANYFGRQPAGQSIFKPRFLLGASIRQELFQKQLSITLNAANLLSTSKMDVRTNSGSLRTNLVMRPELRVLTLTLSYNFNNFKRTNTQQLDVSSDIGR